MARVIVLAMARVTVTPVIAKKKDSNKEKDKEAIGGQGNKGHGPCAGFFFAFDRLCKFSHAGVLSSLLCVVLSNRYTNTWFFDRFYEFDGRSGMAFRGSDRRSFRTVGPTPVPRPSLVSARRGTRAKVSGAVRGEKRPATNARIRWCGSLGDTLKPESTSRGSDGHHVGHHLGQQRTQPMRAQGKREGQRARGREGVFPQPLTSDHRH